MRLPSIKKHCATPASTTLYIKSGAIFLLFIFSVLIAACGSNASGNTIGQPPVTVTIDLNGGSPTPQLPGYYCNAWVTSTTPGVNYGVFPIYAKYVQLVGNNPQGVGGATATATVQWADGSVVTVTATTTADGLAVFPVSTANRGADVGRFSYASVTIEKAGTPGCTVTGSQEVFFSLIYATVTPAGSPSVTPGATGTPCVTPGAGIANNPLRKTPTPVVTPTPTVPPTPTPTPCG